MLGANAPSLAYAGSDMAQTLAPFSLRPAFGDNAYRFNLAIGAPEQSDDCDDEPTTSAAATTSALAAASAPKADAKPAAIASIALNPAPIPIAPAAIKPPPSPTWQIEVADKTLSGALSRWATIAGWQLLWELPVDYAVDNRTPVPGNFEEAVGMVVKSMETAEVPMKAVFYQGNHVLRITARGGD